MEIPIFQVDAFTHQPFSGNPAVVCLLKNIPTDAWLQSVAEEMNVSETAFLVKESEGFRLRWFTPLIEVDLCGHATLASAHILWEEGIVGKEQPVQFSTLHGELIVRKVGEWIELAFPSEPVEFCETPKFLSEALHEEYIFVGRNRMDYLVCLESEAIIRNLAPNFKQLKMLDTRGLIATAPSASEEFDFVSRFFAPAVGIDEDPVTGSAHCGLGPFWAERLKKKELIARQLSARGGVLRVRVDNQHVFILGQAVTVLRGYLRV